MTHRLRPVGIDFTETAPVRLVFARNIAASPDAVFRALAEDVADWSAWFSAVASVRSTDGGREVRLRGGIHFQESVLAAKGPELYTYRVDVTNTPGARAWIEEWQLTPAGPGPDAGTRVRMTFALDGTAVFRFVCRLARAGVGRSFRQAVDALDRRLAG
ncbi:SRPBCC family protein [Streptomyces sp. NPDC002520]